MNECRYSHPSFPGIFILVVIAVLAATQTCQRVIVIEQKIDRLIGGKSDR